MVHQSLSSFSIVILVVSIIQQLILQAELCQAAPVGNNLKDKKYNKNLDIIYNSDDEGHPLKFIESFLENQILSHRHPNEKMLASKKINKV